MIDARTPTTFTLNDQVETRAPRGSCGLNITRVRLRVTQMGFFFAALIVVFAVLALWYLWVNDFARETLDVVFPAIGAILLSAYLGAKTIWLDAPDAQRSRVPIAILTERATGAVHSMVVMRATDPVDRFADFAGIRELDTLQLFTAFAALNLAPRLRAAAEANDSATENQVWMNLVEYTILEWLAQIQNSVGWDDVGTIHLLFGSGGGGGIPGTHQNVSVSLGEKEYNELVTKRNISLTLPPLSKVLRSAKDKAVQRTIEVSTPYSYFRIELSLRGGSQFQGKANPTGAKLSADLGLSNTAGWMTAFMVNLETGQVPHLRFSKQAKREAIWLQRIHAQFDLDFSWDRLRARLYAG